ncbi:protein-L-isoaspartate O-methyltransferase, partial [Vibrio sp. 1288]|nr:protein-L-isoaspartate O-methyltransferase [Vibrio sp. 1288]
GPFDAIIVTAAAEVIPQALLSQLKDGGKMVIPVGDAEQQLLRIERKGDEYLSTVVEMVRFVPLVAGDLA